jgi:NAD(P)H-hydrate epimerase
MRGFKRCEAGTICHLVAHSLLRDGGDETASTVSLLSAVEHPSMITADRMAMVDRNAAALGVPRAKLMESSGNAVARAVRERVDPGTAVTLVCGRGNNGGDAFAAARFLSEYDTRIVLLGRPETITTRIARENWDALQQSAISTETVNDSSEFSLDDPDLIVDAMLGTGVTGALREPEATAARAINDADAPVLSVDVPSGIDADTGEAAGVAVDADTGEAAGVAVDADTGEAAGVAVDADTVITFHDSKPGLARLAEEGEFTVTVADIGIPEAAELFVGPGDLQPLARASDSHKGDHGEVLVVGGGPYTGAPTLAARAALRAGADLVRVAVPSEIAREVQGFDESLIVRSFPGDHLGPVHLDAIRDLAEGHDTVVFGPGLGDADETLDAVGEFLETFDGTAVIDADALSVVPNIETEATLICTPHRGEFAGMGGDPDGEWRERVEHVSAFAAEHDHVLLVKGPEDVISDGETTRVGRTGNPGMTVGGTGDVLAGVTGALATVLDPLQAAAVGAYANGRAGDIVFEERGYGLTATDLLDALPDALRDEVDA